MKKIILLAVPALLLAACTQKVTQTDNTNAARSNVPAATKVASAAASPKNDLGMMMKEGEYKFKLAGIADKSREGWVTLAETDGRVKVSIELMDAKKSPAGKATTAATSSAEAAMPAHIHVGTCPTPGDVKYPLTNVVNGKSVTTLPAGVTIKSLMDLGDLAVNVHKSAADIKTYIACGDLDFNEGMMNKEASESGKTNKATLPPKATGKAAAKTPASSPQY